MVDSISRVRAACFFLLSLSAFACADGDAPLVDQPTTRAPAAALPLVISQKPGFYFLPPLVRAVPRYFTDPFEAGLQPSVEIVQIDTESGATIAPLANWSASRSEGARVSANGEFYVVDWQTTHYDLSSDRAYRLAVSVRDEELGAIILQVTDSSGDVADRQSVPGRVRWGEVFPIKFRIEGRAVDRDADGVVDWKDNCPTTPNPRGGSGAQTDTDEDGVGDACECSSVRCDALDPCHPAGRCVPETGHCTAPALPDDDGDGLCNAVDPCPSNGEKQEPGVCGCDIPDADSDRDEIPDCVDGCPLDVDKVEPGICGCGVPDVDTDSDGALDCYDACPNDPLKREQGACGCGGRDTDTDSDGFADCVDPCPLDPTRSESGPCGAGPEYVDLTWMTITNLYLEAGPVRALLDGYVTRIPQSNFYGGGGGLQNTHSPNVPDVALVSQVLAALGGAPGLNLLLTGHSHFDHSFDTATWSSLTNAPIIGSRTTCFQALAQGIPAERCTEVLGGETLTLAEGVTLRVIRWNHSGDDGKNPEQHAAVELEAVPVPDPVTGGLRAGVSEDFPNGGGGRAFLFTIDGPEGPYSFLFMDSGAAKDLNSPIVVGGVDYGAPLQNLEAALADAGLTSVDVLVAPSANGGDLAKLVVPIAYPKAYIPVHWDNYFAPFLSRPSTFRDTAFTRYLTEQDVRLFAPVQVMDKWRLRRGGVEPIENPTVKAALPLQ